MSIRALIVGMGSIGRRHLANLRALLPDADITVWRHTRPARPEDAIPGADHLVYSLEEALTAAPHLAIIANPAPFHVEAALPLARAQVALLIEKPLADSAAKGEELVQVCAAQRLTLMVGYNLRFSQSMQVFHHAVEAGLAGQSLSMIAEVGQYLPDWRPDTDYTTNVSAQARLGGGAILELSHELDYARYLLGEVRSVSARTARLGDLQMDAENIADISLQFVGGALGNIHLDMLQRSPTRTCKVIGTQGTIEWDGISGCVRCFSATDRKWQELPVLQSSDRNAMYVAELRHFLQCVETRSDPLISGEDGLRTLQLALAVRRAAELQRTVALQA